MDNNLLFKTAMLAGEIILTSGAETYRVEDTMERILSLSGYDSIEVFVTTTGIIATLSNQGSEPITSVKRIPKRFNNLNRIYCVNEVSRKLCEQKISLEEAHQELKEIKTYIQYGTFAILTSTTVATVTFTILFGGYGMKLAVAALNGILIVCFGLLIEKRNKSEFMKNMMISAIIAFTTMACCKGLHIEKTEEIIIGTIMPLVPGIPITNAIRDTLQGDYVSGVARAMEAFVYALAIAVGVGAGLSIFNLLEGLVV